MSASEYLRMAQALFLSLCVFTDIVSTCASMPIAASLEPKLGHDGTEAAVVGTLLQVAVGDDLG